VGAAGPVLVLAVARLDFAHNGTPNRHALYDLGQAVANLTVEATSLGLHIHQMGGFDSRLARELFAIPAGFEPAAVLAWLPERGSSASLSRTRSPWRISSLPEVGAIRLCWTWK